MKRRSFLKRMLAGGLGLALAGSAISAKPVTKLEYAANELASLEQSDSVSRLERLIKSCYSDAGDVAGGSNIGWLTLAYSTGGFTNAEEYYKKRDKINTIFRTGPGRGENAAMVALAYAVSGFDDSIEEFYKDAVRTAGGRNIGWLTLAYAVASGNTDLAVHYENKEKIDHMFKTGPGGGDNAGMVAWAYAASGFDDSIEEFYKDAVRTAGGRNIGWLTLAYAVSSSGADKASYVENKEKIDDMFKHGPGGGENAGMLALAYAVSGFNDRITPSYYTFMQSAGGQNIAFMSLAYAAALNPNNKLFPKR